MPGGCQAGILLRKSVRARPHRNARSSGRGAGMSARSAAAKVRARVLRHCHCVARENTSGHCRPRPWGLERLGAWPRAGRFRWGRIHERGAGCWGWDRNDATLLRLVCGSESEGTRVREIETNVKSKKCTWVMYFRNLRNLSEESVHYKTFCLQHLT